MRVWIERPIEPRQLILAWQAPDEFRDEDRRRWEVGTVYREGPAIRFRYFDEPEFGARNFGRTLEKLYSYGFAGYPAFKFAPGRIYASEVLETFERRIPPRSRTDFKQYLNYFSIPESVDVSLMQLLAISEARLPGDGFSLVDPLDSSMSAGEVSIEIAGYRHESPHTLPSLGAQLELRAEPENEWDPLAVAIYLGAVRIGFVNKIQAPVVGAWLSTRAIECVLLRFNGRQGAPRAYALLKIRPTVGLLAA